MTFEMYVQEELTETKLEILCGQIELSLENGSVYQLKHGDTIAVMKNDNYITTTKHNYT